MVIQWWDMTSGATWNKICQWSAQTPKKMSYLMSSEEVIEGPNILETAGWGQNSEK